MRATHEPGGLERVTVILTLFGRHEFTPRWMCHARRELRGARLLVADGSHDELPADSREAMDRARDGLAIDYIRYPADRGVADYQRKLGDAIGRVRTPYVMLADNDDLHCGDGVRRAVRALDADDGLATARGRVAGMTVSGRVRGLRFPIHARHADCFDYEFRQPLDAPLASERVLAHSGRYAATWYAMMRAEVARDWSAQIAASPIEDLGLTEWMQSCLCCAAGPQLVADWPFLLRQHNVTSKSSDTFRRRADQVDCMCLPAWSADCSRAIEAVARAIAERDGAPMPDAEACARRALHDYLQTRILRQTVSQKVRSPEGIRWLLGVTGGRMAQRWGPGVLYSLFARAGILCGPAAELDRVLPSLRGEGR